MLLLPFFYPPKSPSTPAATADKPPKWGDLNSTLLFALCPVPHAPSPPHLGKSSFAKASEDKPEPHYTISTP